jgi:tetratricopeptide (TPR) repeat protein
MFSRAHQADDQNPYPIYAMAYDQMLNGNWPEAKALLEQVLALRPENPLFRGQWFLSCLAQGQFAEAEQEARGRLQHKPASLEVNLELCELLAAEGKRDEGIQTINRLVRSYQLTSPDEAEAVRQDLEDAFLYAIGDFHALEQSGQAQKKSRTGKLAVFHALLEQNQLDEAEKTLRPMEDQDPVAMAAMSLGWQLAGKTEAAASWRARLADKLRSTNPQGRRTAGLLESTTAPTVQALADIQESLQLKAVMVACLAQVHPEQRDRLNALARKLNVDRSFPYHLVERATAVSP